jgi:hypothetical protein
MFRLLSLNSSMGFWHLAARTPARPGRWPRWCRLRPRCASRPLAGRRSSRLCSCLASTRTTRWAPRRSRRSCCSSSRAGGGGGGGGGDGMRVDSAGAPLAPAAGAGNPRAHLGGERVGGTYAGRPRGIHAQRHYLLRALDDRPARAFAARRDGQPEADRRAGGHGAT